MGYKEKVPSSGFCCPTRPCWYIKIQPKTIDLSTRLWGVTMYKVCRVLIFPRKPIVLDWIGLVEEHWFAVRRATALLIFHTHVWKNDNLNCGFSSQAIWFPFSAIFKLKFSMLAFLKHEAKRLQCSTITSVQVYPYDPVDTDEGYRCVSILANTVGAYHLSE